jgi:hypothetical protein
MVQLKSLHFILISFSILPPPSLLPGSHPPLNFAFKEKSLLPTIPPPKQIKGDRDQISQTRDPAHEFRFDGKEVEVERPVFFSSAAPRR